MSAGIATTVIQGSALLYERGPEDRVFLVAIRELPKTPETLPLRLLGGGKTWIQALKEVLAHPASDPLRIHTQRLAVALCLEEGHTLSSKEDPLMQTLTQIYLDWEKEQQWKGEQKGRQEGHLEGTAQGKSSAILLLLRSRGIPVPPEAETRILQCMELSLLDQWLIRAITAGSVQEVIGEEHS